MATSPSTDSTLSVEYCLKQTIENCCFFSPKDAVITVITSKEPQGKTITAIVLKAEYGQREALLTDSGHTIQEALQGLLLKSGEAVWQYTSTNGYELVTSSEDYDDDNNSVFAASTATSDDTDSDHTLSDGDTVSIASRSRRRHHHTRKAKRSSRNKATNSNRKHTRLSRSRSPSSASSREASPVRPELAGDNGPFSRPDNAARIFPSRPPSGRPMYMAPSPNQVPPPGLQWMTMTPPASLRMQSVPGIATVTPSPPPPPVVPPFPTNTSGRPTPANACPPPPGIRRPASDSTFRPLLAPFHTQNHTMPGPPRPPSMMSKPVPTVGSLSPPSAMQDVRILINWRNHGIQRVLAQAQPSIRGVGGVADVALAYVRRSAPGFENITALDTQPSRLWSLRATVRRAVVDGDSYDLSSYAGDDLRRLLGGNSGDRKTCIPLFEVDVDTPGVPAGFFGAPTMGSGPVPAPTTAPSFPPSFPPPPPSSGLSGGLCEHSEEDEDKEEE